VPVREDQLPGVGLGGLALIATSGEGFHVRPKGAVLAEYGVYMSCNQIFLLQDVHRFELPVCSLL